MTDAAMALRFFLDEGVAVSVGRALENAGHEVIYFNDAAIPGSPDQLVCAVSEGNEAILVAQDGDMKKLAQRRGVGSVRFRRLSLIKLSCRETRAARRIEEAMSLIEHEWDIASGKRDRRIFIEIHNEVIRTNR